MSTTQQYLATSVATTARAHSPAAHTIAIIGGGFSGTVLAANLLKRAAARRSLQPLRIVLVERNAEIGRGVAYAASDYPYLLNVPAARMSVNPADPLEFLHFARRTLPHAGGEDFLPRALYGEYLAQTLRDAQYAAPLHVSLVHRRATAQRLAPFGERFHVSFDSGAGVFADEVVLALGNPPPAEIPALRTLRRHPAYFTDPWNISRSFEARDTVLIIGTALSMADVALKLSDNESAVPQLRALSRHGLLPLSQSHSHGTVPAELVQTLLGLCSTRQLVTATRKLTMQWQHSGGDWRELINAIRGLAPRIWLQLSLREKRRFMRHVQSYWDVCRHRLPPHVLEHLNYLQSIGKLQISAGRIESFTPVGNRIEVQWRPRGTEARRRMMVDAVVNATGPDYRLTDTGGTLLGNLHAEGLLSPDPSGTGLRTGAHGAVIGANGTVNPRLFYLGPLLRAAAWETTAAAELRGHAERLAQLLMERTLERRVASAG